MNLPDIHTTRGESLADLSERHPVMIIFLRHFGCTFTRETMTELAKSRGQLELQNINPVLVHMAAPETAEAIFEIYELSGISHISDPEGRVYKLFGLGRASRTHLFKFKNLWRSWVTGVVKGHWFGRVSGDPYQMPGAFLFRGNQILNTFTFRNLSDRLDMKRLLAPMDTLYPAHP